MKTERFEIVVPERVYIVSGFKEVKNIIERYKLRGITINRLKEKE